MPKVTDACVEWKKKQAVWFQVISRTHRLWCNCGDYCYHLRKQWRGVQDIAFGRGTSDRPGEEKDIGDQLIIQGGGDGFPTASVSSDGDTG